MADTKTPETLLDELAALNPAQWHEVAKELRKVAETFAEGYVVSQLEPISRH
jgi:hypothetical protein